MIPYAELCEALDRYRRRMGFAPAGSSLGGGGAPAPAPVQPALAPAQPAWGAEDSTAVSQRAAVPALGYPDDPLADPPELSGSVDIGDGDILDEEPNN